MKVLITIIAVLVTLCAVLFRILHWETSFLGIGIGGNWLGSISVILWICVIYLFRKSKIKKLDFSCEKVDELKNQTTRLRETLQNNGFSSYNFRLSNALAAAQIGDEIKFRELVISNEIFGGAGALWEIYIDDKFEYEKFNAQFSNYIEALIKIGIRNKRVISTGKSIKKMSRY